MSAPAHIAAGTFAETTGAALNVPYMGSINAKDILFMLVANSQIGVTVGALDTPAGWTAITSSAAFRDSGAQLNGSVGLYYKIATGSESGSETINRTGTTGPGTGFIGRMVQFRGNGANLLINPSQPINQEQFAATVTWLAISGTIVPESTLIAFSAQADVAAIATPSGYTQSIDNDAVNIGHISIDYKEDVTSDGAVTASGGDGDGWVTIHLAIFNPKGRSYIFN